MSASHEQRSRRPEPTVPAVDPIDPVTMADLRIAIQGQSGPHPADDVVPGTIDPGSRQILERETRFILGQSSPGPGTAAQPGRLDPGAFGGIALSGGGIRSATFNLGVLQALASHNLLGNFRYLSSVSGGGYIASALTWWLGAGNRGPAELGQGPAFGTSPTEFPYGTEDPTDAQGRRSTHRLLVFLREHGEYLTPGGGITIWTAAASVLRGMILNGWALFPLLVVLMFFADKALRRLEGHTLPFHVAFALGPLLVPAAMLLVFLVLGAVYSVSTRFDRGMTRSYVTRRYFEVSTGYLLIGAVVSLVGLSPPIVSLLLADWVQAVGPVAALAGAYSVVRSVQQNTTSGSSLIPSGTLAVAGSGVFIYGIWLTGYVGGVALHLLASSDIHGATRCLHCAQMLPWIGVDARAQFVAALQASPFQGVLDAVGWSGALLLFALVWGTLFGWVVNINHLGLHRYYRDRLMETFMPDYRVEFTHTMKAATRAERWPLTCVLPRRDPGAPLGQPYPLINTNLVLVKSPSRIRENRGGDSFVLSPLLCGSNATGWLSTRDAPYDALTLPTAMAISGAALNPGAGVGGVGPTRNRLVSCALAWLNLRLGYWMTNPRSRRLRDARPNHFIPGLLAEVFGVTGYQETSRFVQLSDGGHFENLAVYELVRRRARFILCCDAGEDAAFQFDDLNNMLHRIDEDFGARVEFRGAENQLERLAFERDASTRRIKQPVPHGYIVGTIVYADKSEGVLIYLKATLIERLRPEVLSYHASNPEFPDQTTADQWFDPDQFEAYRELGFAIAKDLLATGRVGTRTVPDVLRHLA